MHHHMSLRAHLEGLAAEGRAPVFELTDNPTLLAFFALVATTELAAFDASKRLRTDSWSPAYECWTESQERPDSSAERFEVTWTPVWGRTDPLAGFRYGWDSALLGSTPTTAMPQDERTAALLMLVTTTFVHLSASRTGSELMVRGAVEADGTGFGYLELDPAAMPARRPQSPRRRADAEHTTRPSA